MLRQTKFAARAIVGGAALSALLFGNGCDDGGQERKTVETDSGSAAAGPSPSASDAGATAGDPAPRGDAAASSAEAGATSSGALDAGAGSPGFEGGTSAASEPEAGTVGSDASPPRGDGGEGDASVPPWALRPDQGKGDGQDVVTIGDSWMAGPLNGAGIQAGLDRAGTRYRHYAVTATTLLSGQIPGQYASAKRQNPKIATVIMTGGGNDIMFDIGSCATKESCAAKLKEISAALDKLWTQMADDGVKDVVYVAYSEDAGATPKENRGMAEPVPICLTGRIICHALQTTDLVMKELSDGIHPTSAANDRIAKALLALMEARGVRR